MLDRGSQPVLGAQPTIPNRAMLLGVEQALAIPVSLSTTLGGLTSPRTYGGALRIEKYNRLW